MSQRYRELQKRCRNLNLYRCGGKGVTLQELEEKVEEAESGIRIRERYTTADPEEEVRAKYPDFYRKARGFIPSIPEGIEGMKRNGR